VKYLIDSNIWIEYFNKKRYFVPVSDLLIQNDVYINAIILAELIPSAKARKEREFIECLYGIESLELTIVWDEIIDIQYRCIRTGINKLGLLDIAIVQNAKQNNAGVFTLDRHMLLLCNLTGVACRNA
jgi:predicted nucleic acid-binding protein